jgi:hypothetical protein
VTTSSTHGCAFEPIAGSKFAATSVQGMWLGTLGSHKLAPDRYHQATATCQRRLRRLRSSCPRRAPHPEELLIGHLLLSLGVLGHVVVASACIALTHLILTGHLLCCPASLTVAIRLQGAKAAPAQSGKRRTKKKRAKPQHPAQGQDGKGKSKCVHKSSCIEGFCTCSPCRTCSAMSACGCNLVFNWQ